MPVLNATAQLPQNRRGFLAAVLAGLVLPLLFFQLLPLFGVELGDSVLTPMNLLLLPIALAFGAGYCAYLYYVCKKPNMLSLGVWLFYPWLGFLCHSLMFAGINLSQNLVLIGCVLLPAGIIGFQQLRTVWDRVPYIKVFLWFTGAMLLYFFFFQDDIQEQRSNASQLTTLGFYYIFAMLLNLAQISLMVIGEKTPVFKQQFLKCFNWLVLINVLLIGFIGIVGYPFPFFHVMDNFTKRACSIFYHPAYFAHYMGFGLIYLLGCLGYYKDQQKDKRTLMLFAAGCVIGFVGFMLTLSKAAILVLFTTLFVMMLLNTTSWAKAIQQIKYGIIVVLVGLCAVWGYEIYSGNSIIGSMMQRFEESRSMDWRDRMNRYLELDLESIWIGHGMSSAKRRMSMFEGYGRDDRDPNFSQMKVVHVHNSYLSQFYDYGFVGITLFVFLAIFLVRRFMAVLKTPAHHPNRIFNITIIGLILYFMMVCLTETVFETPESPFWVLLTAAVLAEGRIRRQWT